MLLLLVDVGQALLSQKEMVKSRQVLINLVLD